MRFFFGILGAILLLHNAKVLGGTDCSVNLAVFGRELRMERVTVIPYQNDWPQLFSDETRRIKAALPDLNFKPFHIGSTAVEGLSAKPTIDMMFAVADINAFDESRSAFEALGYDWLGENGIPGRRFLVKRDPATGSRSFHLHVFTRGDEQIDTHLKFRDRLRNDPKLREDYEALKSELARKYANNRDAYWQGKQSFILNALRDDPE